MRAVVAECNKPPVLSLVCTSVHIYPLVWAPGGSTFQLLGTQRSLGRGRLFTESTALTQTCGPQVLPTQDRLEGLRAFAEKRTPVFTGL